MRTVYLDSQSGLGYNTMSGHDVSRTLSFARVVGSISEEIGYGRFADEDSSATLREGLPGTISTMVEVGPESIRLRKVSRA